MASTVRACPRARLNQPLALSSNSHGGRHVFNLHVHGARSTAPPHTAGRERRHDSHLEGGLSTHRRHARFESTGLVGAPRRQPRVAPSIDAFPPQGFADRFFAAVRDGTAPDVLVFDNFGILKGITTGLGSFVGIGQDPVVRNQLVQVTRSFDELLGPARGWNLPLYALGELRRRSRVGAENTALRESVFSGQSAGGPCGHHS